MYLSRPVDQKLLLHCLFSSVLEIDLTITFDYLNFLLTKEYQLPYPVSHASSNYRNPLFEFLQL